MRVRPYMPADERARLRASAALIYVFTEELIMHGSDHLPKFRRAREITRQLRALKRQRF